jgi:sugar-specific transcriptional regulator TrmB
MDEQLISQIEELGLSNKEARVYLANLMLGAAGVQQIADASGIKRVTTYVILESLVNLGLVSQTTKAKKTLFNAEAPENLRRLLEKREQSLKDQHLQLEELLPGLATLKALPKEAPVVKFYDGAESVRTISKLFAEVIQEKKVGLIYGISNLDAVYRFFPEIKQRSANPERIKAGTPSKFLYASSEGSILKDNDAQSNRSSRYVPSDKFPFTGDISIAGDYTALLSLSDPKPIGITIESKVIADSMRAVFDLAWETAEKYQDL